MNGSDVTDILSEAILNSDTQGAEQLLPEVLDSPPPSPQRESINPWDPRLILDIAIGVEGLDTILPRYNLTEDQFLILSETQAFRQELSLAIRDARENGVQFKHKAKAQAENYLDIIDEIILDVKTPQNVKLEAIRSMVKWAELEPKKDAASETTATQVNVNISF